MVITLSNTIVISVLFPRGCSFCLRSSIYSSIRSNIRIVSDRKRYAESEPAEREKRVKTDHILMVEKGKEQDTSTGKSTDHALLLFSLH